MKRLFTANRETGTFIEEVKTYAEGLALIAQYEADDKANGTYTADFYDVVDEDHCTVSPAAQRMKDIRSKTGLSARAFGELYNIPMRTIQDWEHGKRQAPEYVLDMLAHEVALNDVLPMVYVFYSYRDAKGYGETHIFTSKENAITAAMDAWDALTESDRDTYIDDPAGEFCVTLVPAEWDEVSDEYVPDMSEYTPIWRAFEPVHVFDHR